MANIYEAGGRYSTRLEPPMLVCKGCRAIIRPGIGQTEIACKCGRTYKLLAEGHPIHKLKV